MSLPSKTPNFVSPAHVSACVCGKDRERERERVRDVASIHRLTQGHLNRDGPVFHSASHTHAPQTTPAAEQIHSVTSGSTHTQTHTHTTCQYDITAGCVSVSSASQPLLWFKYVSVYVYIYLCA